MDKNKLLHKLIERIASIVVKYIDHHDITTLSIYFVPQGADLSIRVEENSCSKYDYIFISSGSKKGCYALTEYNDSTSGLT
ncbi:hypothetical protein KAR91_10645 [Candidatus Pacearchaeota archaeon]|nr:hypothetical protein [Candidatus Pacearchaeota archaeon]